MINIKLFGSEKCSNCVHAKNIIEKSLQDGYIDSFEYFDIYIPENFKECSRLANREITRIPVIFVNGKECSFQNRVGTHIVTPFKMRFSKQVLFIW